MTKPDSILHKYKIGFVELAQIVENPIYSLPLAGGDPEKQVTPRQGWLNHLQLAINYIEQGQLVACRAQMVDLRDRITTTDLFRKTDYITEKLIELRNHADYLCYQALEDIGIALAHAENTSAEARADRERLLLNITDLRTTREVINDLCIARVAGNWDSSCDRRFHRILAGDDDGPGTP